MQCDLARVDSLGSVRLTNKLAKAGEIVAVFAVALALIIGAGPLVGDSPLERMSVIAVAYMAMMVMVWLGLRLRGQSWEHFGLSFRLAGRRAIVVGVLQSLVVFIVVMAAFLVGAIVMANIVGMPEKADMSGYDFLRGNLPMLIVSLGVVYFVSAFGEEVIFRAFLINRIAELCAGGKAAWWLAVVLSAILFGLCHFAWGPAGIVQTGFMGLALGASYLFVGRNLWVTILTHVYMDTILIVPIYFSGT